MEDIIQAQIIEISPKANKKSKLQCKYCFKDLSSRQNLREHMYIHTGEKPYICNEPGCNQTFRQGSLLSIHRRIHSEVKKGRRDLMTFTRAIRYPKLTDLMISKFQEEDAKFWDIEKMREEIEKKDFEFLKEFI